MDLGMAGDSSDGMVELSGQGSPVVKALPAYSTGVIDFVVQQLAWVQNPVVVARQLLAGVS
ncbi:MAG TPA: hypothetical protein VKP12_03315, partial [Kiloniellaceae bacterium]|nr:hypothetical protein [Kiloniellaceae bacterium]